MAPKVILGLFQHIVMTNDDELSVITQKQLAFLFANIGNSYSGDQINSSLAAAFGYHLKSNKCLSFLERNAIHHGILDMVKNSESDDEIGKNIADAIDDIIQTKIAAFLKDLYENGTIAEDVKKQIGKVRRVG